MTFGRTTAPRFGIISADNSRIAAFNASVGTSETWKVRVCAKRRGECAQLGACLSRGSHRAFPGPQTKHGKRVRPLSLPVIGQRALGSRVARIVRAARTARPFWEGRASARPHRINVHPTRMESRHLGGYWCNGHLGHCTRPLLSIQLSERTHPETLSFPTSNLRNSLRPQAPSANQPRAKE